MTFSISAKIQDGGQKLEKPKSFRVARGVVHSTLGVQNLPEITISYGFWDKQYFPFPPKFKMAVEILKSLNFSDVLEE